MTQIHSATLTCQAESREALIGSLRELINDLEIAFKDHPDVPDHVFFGSGDYSSSSGLYSGPDHFEFLQREDFDEKEFERTLEAQGITFSEDESG